MNLIKILVFAGCLILGVAAIPLSCFAQVGPVAAQVITCGDPAIVPCDAFFPSGIACGGECMPDFDDDNNVIFVGCSDDDKEEKVTANAVQVIGEGVSYSVWTEGSPKVICSISRGCGCGEGPGEDDEPGALFYPCRGEGGWAAGTEVSQWFPSGPPCIVAGGGGGPGGPIVIPHN